MIEVSVEVTYKNNLVNIRKRNVFPFPLSNAVTTVLFDEETSYEVLDLICPFDFLDVPDDLKSFNKLMTKVIKLSQDKDKELILRESKEILSHNWFESFEELVERIDKIKLYRSCNSLGECYRQKLILEGFTEADLNELEASGTDFEELVGKYLMSGHYILFADEVMELQGGN